MRNFSPGYNKKTAPLINTALDKGRKPNKTKTSSTKQNISHNDKVKRTRTNPVNEEKKKKTRGKNYQSEVLSEEMKQRVYELYGDDAQFDDIQLHLTTAMNEGKRPKSATPNKNVSYKEVVLKLHNKVMQKQKESEADILKRIIERQKKAQQQRKLRSLERQQQLAKKNKERLQQVKERQAEIEAEKIKQGVENEMRVQQADERHGKHLNGVKTRAHAETEKSEELQFIRGASTTGKRLLMDTKLAESSERRKAILDQTKQKQDVISTRSDGREKKISYV